MMHRIVIAAVVLVVVSAQAFGGIVGIWGAQGNWSISAGSGGALPASPSGGAPEQLAIYEICLTTPNAEVLVSRSPGNGRFVLAVTDRFDRSGSCISVVLARSQSVKIARITEGKILRGTYRRAGFLKVK